MKVVVDEFDVRYRLESVTSTSLAVCALPALERAVRRAFALNGL